jgi:hypothetical protein
MLISVFMIILMDMLILIDMLMLKLIDERILLMSPSSSRTSLADKSSQRHDMHSEDQVPPINTEQASGERQAASLQVQPNGLDGMP